MLVVWKCRQVGVSSAQVCEKKAVADVKRTD